MPLRMFKWCLRKCCVDLLYLPIAYCITTYYICIVIKTYHSNEVFNYVNFKYLQKNENIKSYYRIRVWLVVNRVPLLLLYVAY